MNYNEALSYIHSFLKFGSKPGLERVTALLEMVGNPQNNLRIIHVAGTNGKGTVSTMIANILTCSGIKTGLFTSPYVVSFCERMKIDGKMICEEDLTNLTEKFKPLIQKLNEKNIYPTEFELITAMAFDYFREKECEFAVIEVGLGGLYDSTNVVKKPIISVITHVDFDHENILGNTIEEIAHQKFGIVKKNCPCVVYPEQYDKVFEIAKAKCAENNSMLVIPNMEKITIKSENLLESVFSYKGEIFKLNLAGRHQILNAITAYEAIKTVLPEARIKEGVEKTVMPARIEIINRNPLVILDGAHNPDGAKALWESVKDMGSKVVVLSMMKDKDVDKSLHYLLKEAKKVIVTKCSNPRAMEVDELAGYCRRYCSDSDVIVKENIFDSFKESMEIRDNMPVVICGSLYLASEIRKHIKKYFLQNK